MFIGGCSLFFLGFVAPAGALFSRDMVCLLSFGVSAGEPINTWVGSRVSHCSIRYCCNVVADDFFERGLHWCEGQFSIERW